MIARYMPQSEIDQMASAAVTCYEMACSWRRAGEAAREYAADDLGVRATSAQVALAVRLAQTRWQGIAQSIRREIAA